MICHLNPPHYNNRISIARRRALCTIWLTYERNFKAVSYTPQPVENTKSNRKQSVNRIYREDKEQN